jgi:Asp-tRNA(Asn)/Glu-tRNA(Gln) amidotransferase A subunit family amidase
MARTVADRALAYSVLSGTPVPAPRLKGLAVGVLDPTAVASAREPGAGTVGQITDMRESLRRLEDMGARLVPVEVPSPATDLVPIMLHEASVEHAATLPSRREQYGEDTR